MQKEKKIVLRPPDACVSHNHQKFADIVLLADDVQFSFLVNDSNYPTLGFVFPNHMTCILYSSKHICQCPSIRLALGERNERDLERCVGIACSILLSVIRAGQREVLLVLSVDGLAIVTRGTSGVNVNSSSTGGGVGAAVEVHEVVGATALDKALTNVVAVDGLRVSLFANSAVVESEPDIVWGPVANGL